MEKEFIPYEESFTLKELGFDEICLARFDGGGFQMLPAYDPLKNSEIKESWFCVSPTFSQAFRWFRDKYNLLFYIKKGYNPSNYYLVINEESHKYNKKMWFYTYEEAELACLIKLIEIVKNEI